MNVLSIDEDAFFKCTNECLEKFPRIQSVLDYLDLNKIHKCWERFYDAYEASFNLELIDFIPIYFSSSVRNSSKKVRIFTHDELLDFLNFELEDLYLVNIDQHHDQSCFHSRNIDCSNWAYPNMLKQVCPNLTNYQYVWLYSPITSDFQCCSQVEDLNYKVVVDSLFNFNLYFLECFDLVVFCKSLAYVPSNYWNFFTRLFDDLN